MKYASGRFGRLGVELCMNAGTENEKRVMVYDDSNLFNLKIAAGNYGSVAEELIPEASVKGFTMRPADVKRRDLRAFDGVYDVQGNRVDAMTKDFLENVAVVRDMVVSIPVEEGAEDMSKRVAIANIMDVIVADAIVDTPEELIDAVENANDGDVIEIMGSMTLTEPLVLTKGITLDLGGNTLTGSVVFDGANGELCNGTLVSADGVAVTLKNAGSVVLLDDVVIEGATDAIRLEGCVLNVFGGTVTAKDGYAIHSVSGTDNEIHLYDGVMKGSAGALKADVDTAWDIVGGTYSSDPSEYIDQEYYTVIQNEDGTYTVKVQIPFTIDWYGTYVPTDTKITRTTTGRVTISKNGVPLPNKAAYTEQLENWELVYDPEYLEVKTAPTAAPSYINFVLVGKKAGETTIEYRNKIDNNVKVSKTIKIDHYLSLSITPSGTHMVEAGNVEIADGTTFDGEPIDFTKFTFTSNDITIASVDGRAITPHKGGVVTLTATNNDDASIFATSNVTFVEAAAKIGDVFYDTIKGALKVAKSGDLVVLQRDVTESVMFTGETPREDGFVLDIDLNGHTWTSATSQSYAFRSDYGVVTIKDSVGGGAITYGKDYALVVSHLAGDYISKLIILDGTFTGKTSVLQAGTAGGSGANKKYYGGEVEIRGGTFITVPDEGESYDEQGNFRYSLNMLDMNESAYPGGIYSPSKITVMGGSFKQFDPANCAAEGPNTNFVADGYGSVKDGDFYKVAPTN